MYATIRRYTAKKGAAQSLRAELEKSFLPVVRSIKGFSNYYYVYGGEENGRDDEQDPGHDHHPRSEPVEPIRLSRCSWRGGDRCRPGCGFRCFTHN